MHMLINLAIIIITQLHLILSTMENNINYWIELELQAVHWRPTCLTTGGCANPRFRISKFNKFNAEIISISWSITENFVERHSRKFITHWLNGKPHEITLQCDVIGMDPLYGFLRTCDTTQNIEIFKENNEFQELNTYQMLESSEDELSMNERNGKLIVEIRAKCFNASFIARKYMKHCPWCSVPDDMTLIESAAPEYETTDDDAKMSLAKKFVQFFLGEQILLIFLLSLLLISLLGLICLLLIISKQRHFISLLQKRSQPNNHLNSYLYSKQFSKSVKNADDRYDVPWDQHCILQRFWINDNSNIDDNKQQTIIASGISKQPSASLAYIPRKTTITGTLSTISKRLSPNSSLCEQHEDSGLESV
ncbi:hypothetical protein QQG55_1210 [Brugia pahangi]